MDEKGTSMEKEGLPLASLKTRAEYSSDVPRRDYFRITNKLDEAIIPVIWWGVVGTLFIRNPPSMLLWLIIKCKVHFN